MSIPLLSGFGAGGTETGVADGVEDEYDTEADGDTDFCIFSIRWE